jgi:hypothetical protein
MTNSTRKGWGVSVTPRPLFTPGNDPVPIVQEAGWAPGPVWTDAENIAPTEIRSPDRPARSSVAIPTELPGPHDINVLSGKRTYLKSWCVTFRPTCIFESKSSKITDVIHPGFVDFRQLCLGVRTVLFRTPNVPGFPQSYKNNAGAWGGIVVKALRY